VPAVLALASVPLVLRYDLSAAHLREILESGEAA
jgi:hypothetical protein